VKRIKRFLPEKDNNVRKAYLIHVREG
jgi:hypothetical protein